VHYAVQFIVWARVVCILLLFYGLLFRSLLLYLTLPLFNCSIVSLLGEVPIVDSCAARCRLLCGHYAEVAYELLFAPGSVPNNHVFTQMSYI
jgi:hypothetical protein